MFILVANTSIIKQLIDTLVQFYQQQQDPAKPKPHSSINILLGITANGDFGWIRSCF
jgi:hypothetical protein